MLGSYGLSTHIWNNRLKSVLLLAGFPVLLLLVIFAFALLISAFSNPDSIGEGFRDAFEMVPGLIPVALVGAGIWFLVAWFANQKIVDAITGAHAVDRQTAPRLWNLLENLCISRGIPMPKLRIIDSDALNAFASGVRPKQYAITVTRGLVDALDDAELEAVLGHELTHIRNRDVQLLVIAAIFVGVITLVGDLLVRSPRVLFQGGGRVSRGSSRGGKGGGGIIVLILVAIAIFILARLLALALRFAVSRKREFLADAGAVELTKNADAMIGALRKIEGRSALAAPSQVQQMFIDLPLEGGIAGWFASHPPIDARVLALKTFAGGHEPIATPEIPATGFAAGAQAALDRPEFGRREAPPASIPPAAGEAPPAKGPWT